MGRSTFRVLVVDDYKPWRSFATRALQEKLELLIIGEASDGLEAVQKAQELQPDLILLDIGIPTINGIEAARRILQSAPNIKILFVSEQRSPEIAMEALGTGSGGYVIKSKAASELLPAVEAVLQGKRFVSASLTGFTSSDPQDEVPAHYRSRDKFSLTPLAKRETARRHELGFYSDDGRLLGDVTQFIGPALQAGNAAVVVATESHRNGLLLRLQAQGVNVAAATEEGRYIAFDVKDALSTFVVDGTLDPVRFLETFGNLIATAASAARIPRVTVFGEGTHLLWTQGYVDAAIQDEKLCNDLLKIYEVDILCGFSAASIKGRIDTPPFQQICAEHSAVYFDE